MFLKVQEAAERLRISRAQAYALVRQGEIPSIRISDHGIRIDADAFEAWIAEHSTQQSE